MLNQRYDTPEKLSGTDAEVIQWRRLVVTKQFGGRNAPFEYKNPDDLPPDAVPLEPGLRPLPPGADAGEGQRRAAGRGLNPVTARATPATRSARVSERIDMADERMSRRQLMRAVLVGASRRRSPGPAPPRPTCRPTGPRSSRRAKKEGKVVVNTFPGDGYKRALKAFTQAYPDIKLEHTGLHSQDFAPRILQERQANLYTWDVVIDPHEHRAAGAAAGRGLGSRSGPRSSCPRSRTTPPGRAASSAASPS